MKDGEKGRKRLVEELRALRQRIAELEAAESEHRRTEEALRDAEQRYRRIAENAMDVVSYYSYDPEDHGTRFVNRAVEDVVGYAPEEYYGDPHLDWKVTHPEDRHLLRRAEDLLRETKEPVTTQIRLVHREGHTVHVEAKYAPILDGQGDVIACVGVSRDITERRQVEQQLAYMATHDALTGLPNRTLFSDRLTVALAQAQRNQRKLAVLLLDLDHFKDVNDTLRHSVGDQLLQVVGRRLTSLLRKSDTVARMGGDEFLVLVPEIARAQDSAKVASKIVEAFREPFLFAEHELHITTSIGIAVCPCDGEDADTLLKNADIAMYRAKNRGRNTYERYAGNRAPVCRAEGQVD